MSPQVPAPKKRLGQHFLSSPHYARRIAEAVEAREGDTVVEIGPGRGALSVFLRERFPLFHCIEQDADLIPHLQQNLGAGRYTVHNADVLTFDLASLGARLHVVGNLPYNIGALIIKKTLLCVPAVVSVIFMVQREVAERIVAPPHTKQNGFLTIFCGFFGAPRILFHCAAGAFVPRPKVASSVFRLDVGTNAEERLPRAQWDRFFSLVSKGFSMRRKMLVKALSLSTGQDKEVFAAGLEKAGLDRNVRAEDLGVAEWVRLFVQVAEAF